MKLHVKSLITFVVLAGFSGAVVSQTNKETKLKGPYLGQPEPGLTAEVFAPDIVSTSGWEYGVVFAPSMKEMYMVREVNADTESEQEFVVYELNDESWNERVISKRVGTPTLSPDNKIMFFGRGYKERTKDGWSEMKRLGKDFEQYRIMRVTSSFNGTIAFDEAISEGKGVLRYSTLKNGKRTTPKPFPKQINTGTWNAHPFIAPDESYVIWDGHRGENADNSDLFISFKEPDGSWGEAIKFGDNINTPDNDFAAQLSPDGKYLFFNRNGEDRNVDTFWVDAKVIEQLKPAHIKAFMANKAPKGTAYQASGSFRDIPLLDKAFTDTSPTSDDKSLSADELSLAKDKTDAIIKLAEEIGQGEHGHYDSLLIAKNNKLVFESYHQRGRYDLAHGQASATKGYTSLIVGRAIQLGYLSMADLDKPVIHFLKKIDTRKLAKGAEKITLHKALTMHGGLTINREKWLEIEKSPEKIHGQKLVQTLLENSATISAKTQTYNYGNFNPILVMSVIDAVVPGGAKEFIKSEILDKLNIANYKWDTHPSGLPQAGYGVNLTSRDMLKLGNIVVNDGKWQGEQFVSADYLSKATSSITDPVEDWIPEEYRYGYYWYNAPVKVNDKTYNVSFAWGGGGQRLIVVEELELVIAITGHDREDKIMAQISSIVIPAFTG
ncbi:serine hydrolase [Thalassotalea sp. Y01]|uniref:serine hydrolase n=1 Tax=Thalassotalea sp. Y01 TaxID=2729613 RepID=UPI00145E84FE|nr:serine hydrolase [Thalassotalea sp. Y01]NMP17709.1 serine hydrolase [Thalassotalea sp. Y01]